MQVVNHNPHMCPYTTISPAFAMYAGGEPQPAYMCRYTTISPAFAMYAGGEPRGKPFKRALHVIHSKCQRCCVVACMLTSSKVWCSKGKPFKRALHVIHGKCQRCCRSMSTYERLPFTTAYFTTSQHTRYDTAPLTCCRSVRTYAD